MGNALFCCEGGTGGDSMAVAFPPWTHPSTPSTRWTGRKHHLLQVFGAPWLGIEPNLLALWGVLFCSTRCRLPKCYPQH